MMTDTQLLNYVLKMMQAVKYYKKYPSRSYVASSLNDRTTDTAKLNFLLQDSCAWEELAGKEGYMISYGNRKEHLLELLDKS